MKRKNPKFEFEPAFDIKNKLMELAPKIEDFQHIDLTRVFCFRSVGLLGQLPEFGACLGFGKGLFLLRLTTLLRLFQRDMIN